MVNIAKFLREKKASLKAAMDRKSQLDNMQRAAELQRLRQERIKAEGKAKLETARQNEIERIKAAKSKTSKFAAFGKGLAAVINKQKPGKIKSRGKKSGSSIFAEANRGSTGLQFGSGATASGLNLAPVNNSPFNPKRKK